MCRVYPTKSKWEARGLDAAARSSAFTVWKKSSMAFQGTDGFSVFDGKGRLAFRVDNYSRKKWCTTRGLVLMDGNGKALLTMKPQILSMYDQWNGFEGDGISTVPIFLIRRRSVIQSSDEAEVFMCGHKYHAWTPDFRINGCFRRRNCKILSGTGELVAEICRKKANNTILLSDDVFSLVIRPGYDSEMIMAFVVIMDRICRNPFGPSMCS